MANSYGKFRTNYFSVTDNSAFEELIAKLVADQADVEIIDDNCGKVGFMASGSMCGMLPDGCCDNCEECPKYDECETPDSPSYSVDDFLKKLQKLLPEGEACIITEIGWEKMRWLYGGVTVVTKDMMKYTSLESKGMDMAKKLLDDPDWTTQNDY